MRTYKDVLAPLDETWPQNCILAAGGTLNVVRHLFCPFDEGTVNVIEFMFRNPAWLVLWTIFGPADGGDNGAEFVHTPECVAPILWNVDMEDIVVTFLVLICSRQCLAGVECQ